MTSPQPPGQLSPLPPSLSRLAAANPAPPDDHLGSNPAAQSALQQILAGEPAPPSSRTPNGRQSRRRRIPIRLDHLIPVVSAVMAIAVAVVFLSTRSPRPSTTAAGPGTQLTYRVEPTAQSPVTHASIARAITVMGTRIRQLGLAGTSIRRQGGREIVVRLPAQTRDIARAESLIGSTARIEFYDWEADALVPPRKAGPTHTVASLLTSGNPSALAISQAGGRVAPGSASAAAGALTLYAAVRLAAAQPYSPNKTNSQDGDQYFLFSPRETLLAGPLQVNPGTPRSAATRQLEAGLPAADRTDGQVLVVRQGTVVLQAAPNSFSEWPAFGSPKARYYVLKDHVGLFGNQITDPVQSTDPSGAPAISFGFTGAGADQFRRLTRAVSLRGELDSTGRVPLDQHFAVAIDNQLLEVASIDYKIYPDGISGDQGAQLAAGFSAAAARSLAAEMRLGALAVRLVLVSAGPAHAP